MQSFLMDGALVNQSTHEESLVGSRILFPDGLAVALYHDAAGLGGSWGAVQTVVARGGLWRCRDWGDGRGTSRFLNILSASGGNHVAELRIGMEASHKSGGQLA